IMKKDLWLIIFFYAVLLAGCTYAFSTFFPSTVKPLNETQNKNGIQLTLSQVIYSHNWQNQNITLYFKFENQEDSTVELMGSTNPDTPDNMLLLKNAKEQFPLVGYSWEDTVAKDEGDRVIYSFPAGM